MGTTMEDQAEKFREQKKHNSLLMVASSRGYLADAEALVELGAALDCKDKKGRCPLHFAAAKGRTEVARFLWSRGAEVDAETPEGRTPLHLAALGGHAEVATLLLQKGAWAEAYDSRDDTPLHLAARHGHTAVMEVLVEHGAKTNSENKQGLTAMGCALLSGHVPAAKLLQGWGASLAERPHGYSLLHLAAGMAQPASVSFLLDCGADANERDNREGATPLHSAALGGCVRCTGALLAAGADSSLADAEGRLPADLAAPQDVKLREVLKPQAEAKVPSQAGSARGSEAGTFTPPKSAQEQFQALTEAEQHSKVERWSLLDAADLAAALRQYPADAAAETSARIDQLTAARKLLNIHKAVAALHGDEDFQADAAQPRVREAIDAIRADTSKYERYAADPQILTVLQKMRRLHSVAQANGQRTISIDDMLAQPGQEKKDAERQLAIEAACAAHLAAAAAAAAAPSGQAEAAAKAAFDSALQRAKERANRAGDGGKSTAAAAAAPAATGADADKTVSSSAASLLRQRLSAVGGDKGATGRSRPEQARSEAAGHVLEQREQRPDEEADLPEWMRGGFTWKKVWQEFWRQTQLAMLMLVVFLLVSVVVRRKLPWQP